MKFISMTVLVLLYLFYYVMCHVKLHLSLLSIGSSFFNKAIIFILINIVLYLMVILHNLFGDYDSVPTKNDDLLEEEYMPCESEAIIVQEEVVSESFGIDELVEEKAIILVEKYAEEEDLEEEEQNMIDFCYINGFAMKVGNGDDTGWQLDLIQESVKGLELVVVENLVEDQVKEIVCIENELDKLELDALNRKFDEFISVQRRRWQLDATEQLQLVKM